MAVDGGNFARIFPGLSTSVDVLPKNLLNVRGAGNFGAREPVNDCDKIFRQGQ